MTLFVTHKAFARDLGVRCFVGGDGGDGGGWTIARGSLMLAMNMDNALTLASALITLI